MTFSYPVKQPYRTSSPFGPRVSPITNQPEWHMGWDIVPLGDDGVYAGGNGEVISKGYHNKSGWFLSVLYDYIDGRKWLGYYAHLAKRPGVSNNVVARQRIASVGATGSATGKHLHFEVHLGSRKVDPSLFMDGLKLICENEQLERWLNKENERKNTYWDWLMEWELSAKEAGINKPNFKCVGGYCTNLCTGKEGHFPPA